MGRACSTRRQRRISKREHREITGRGAAQFLVVCARSCAESESDGKREREREREEMGVLRGERERERGERGAGP